MRYFFSSGGDYLGAFDDGAIGSVPGGSTEVFSPPNHGYDKLIAGVIVPYVQPWISTFSLGREYDSGEQTITSAGLLSLTHNLGAVPKFITYKIKNISTELNYAVGDEVLLAGQLPPGNASAGVSILSTTTIISIRFGSSAPVFTIPNKTTGASQNIAPAKWKLIVKAYA